MAPTKQQQLAEARKNQTVNQEVPPETIADNVSPEADVTPAPVRTAPPADPDPRRPQTIRKDARDDIVKSFREARNQQTDDDADEINRFTRSGMPPELLALEDETLQQEEPVEEQLEELPGEVVEEEPVEPIKRKLIVRGKELHVTDDELIALAQKAAAGDDYLDEAKRKLKEVDELMRPLRAGRDSQTTTQSSQNNQQQNGQVDQTQVTDEHNVDPFEKVIETIQFGDLKEAARQLREVTTSSNQVDTRKIAAEQLEQERMRNEAIRSQKILKDFEGQHPDLAKDENAVAVMRTRLFQLQRDDLKALGLDEAQIPTSEKDISDWHMWYRQKGHGVRDVDVLLKTARDDFMKWKGIKEQPAAPTNNAAPRVEVTVDRQQRRAAIPQQPSRTVAPKPDAIAQPAPQRSRSDIVQDMINARGRPRQKVIVQ
jgi:hypothetical protein